MGEGLRTAKKILFIIYLVCLHIVAAYFICAWLLAKYVYPPDLKTAVVSAPAKTEEVPIKIPDSPTPLPMPSSFNNSNIDRLNTNQAAADPSPYKGDLIIPVAGVKPEQLNDSFSDARSEGRVHDAIDIPAPAGTPVIAAADGEIVKFFDSHLGGTTIYQLTSDRKFVLYYAHLQSRAGDIAVGDIVKQGRTIGFVGDTGNAGPGNYHLHFSLALVTDPKRYWEGTNINPFPILRNRTALPSN